METLNNFFINIAFSDVVIIATIVGLISGSITIWKFLKKIWNKRKNYPIISASRHNQSTTITNNIFNQVNIIRQNNVISHTNNHQALALTIDKNTFKYILVFAMGAICSYLTIKFIIKQKIKKGFSF